MAYQTGSATSPSNLLDSIRLFLANHGWTVNYWGGETETTSAGLDANRATSVLAVKSPAGGYYQMMCFDSSGDFYTSGATGWDGAKTRNKQPGHSSGGYVHPSSRNDAGWALTNSAIGPYAAYYLFVADEYCHVVVEVTTNRFMHFHVGQLEKGGNYTGGEYFTNTYWVYSDLSQQNIPDSVYHTMPFDGQAYYGNRACAVRVDVDGALNNWVNFSAIGGQSANYAQGFLRGNSLVQNLIGKTANTINGMSVFLPSIITGPRPLGGVAIYGTVKDTHPVNMSSLTPKQVITIGTDQWMVFPVIRKGSGTQYEAVSGVYGIAYRVVT